MNVALIFAPQNKSRSEQRLFINELAVDSQPFNGGVAVAIDGDNRCELAIAGHRFELQPLPHGYEVDFNSIVHEHIGGAEAAGSPEILSPALLHELIWLHLARMAAAHRDGDIRFICLPFFSNEKPIT